MTRLATVPDLNVDDAITDAFVDAVTADVNYMTVQGADIASAATLNITAGFHAVTGAATVDNIADALGVVAGQRVTLLVKNGPLTIRNNGAGGNIRTLSGVDVVLPANAIISFVYDGAVWREAAKNIAVGEQIDYAQITASVTGITATSEAAAVTIITGASKVYDGGRVRVEFYCPRTANSGKAYLMFVLFRDGLAIGSLGPSYADSALGALGTALKGEFFDTPAAGAHTYSVKAFTSGGTHDVIAGPGGSGQSVPAWLRTSKA